MREAVGFKSFLDRAIRSAHPVEKLDCFEGMRGSVCSIEKHGIEKALFDFVRMPAFVSDRKSPCSIHRSECIRIGLRGYFIVLIVLIVCVTTAE